ncbi:hypothetical protein B0T21DRAFT_379057 [Apiosordaria backusii]|uniref:Uncharacterized protein n=1 Tax=Apiosordaria backusii TaxID=314023 RepID=A0AA40DFC1_9PEZI|nr:hypothetical protein B0T21DRAFT_379057 [Apiosordaria backusii]
MAMVMAILTWSLLLVLGFLWVVLACAIGADEFLMWHGIDLEKNKAFGDWWRDLRTTLAKTSHKEDELKERSGEGVAGGDKLGGGDNGSEKKKTGGYKGFDEEGLLDSVKELLVACEDLRRVVDEVAERAVEG